MKSFPAGARDRFIPTVSLESNMMLRRSRAVWVRLEGQAVRLREIPDRPGFHLIPVT